MSKEIKDPQAAAGNSKEIPCPRCGDLFYHPKSLIADEKQRAAEWEEIAKRAEAQLKAVQEENDELKKELHFRKAQIAVGEDTEASLQARNKALAEENEGLEKLLLRNFNDNCTKEDMEAFMKIYARYHPEALAQEKEPRS